MVIQNAMHFNFITISNETLKLDKLPKEEMCEENFISLLVFIDSIIEQEILH